MATRAAKAYEVQDKDVIFTKLQRELTRAREDARGEAIQADYARLPVTDPARMAHDAMGPTTALITLPNARSRFSPRELRGTFVTLFGTADPPYRCDWRF